MLDRLLATWKLARPGTADLGGFSALLAERYGDRILLEDLWDPPGPLGRRRWTARELEHDVARLAGGLREAGLADGALLLVLDNRVDLLVWLLATVRAGAIAVPVNARLEAEEIAIVAEATGATAAVTDAERHEVTAEAVARVGTVEDLPSLGTPCPPGPPDPGRVAVYLTTSGTTGKPKAAALTSRGLLGPFGWLATMPVGRERGPRAQRDQVLSALPLTHVMGIAVGLGALSAGVHWLHRPRFDAAALLDDLEALRPNVFVGVPTMYVDLEEAGAHARDLSSVQLWFSGADRMPEDRALRFQGLGASVVLAGRPLGRSAFVDTYGMVELSGPAAVRIFLPSPDRLVLKTPHRLLPGVQARAVDEQGAPMRWGRVGELAFRGPGVLRGYRGHARSGPDEDGWFRSGDFGRVWPGGWFTFAGRRADRLKVCGFSVFPAEVEAKLITAPQVREVALVGVPDARMGERPVAVVVPEDGFDRGAFLAWAEQHVAGYRRPREVVLLDALPRGPNGKIDRRAATRRATEAPPVTG